MNRRKIILTCIAIYILAAGVRFIVWQNNHAVMAEVQNVVTAIYLQDAQALIDGDFARFLAGPDSPSNADILLHPPGYPIFITAVRSLFGSVGAFQIVQILINSFAPILLFLIAIRVFGFRTAVIVGVLGSMSPQFAYHSAIVLPDELSVLPILVAVYAMTRAMDGWGLANAVLLGASIGVSCWLRSNAMLLPVYFAAASLVLLPRELRLRFAFVLLGTFLLAIAPITIRNLVYFHAFVPLSVGMGTTLVEGLGDYDHEGAKGLPKTDEQVMELDARLAGRPDYREALYNPDGIERERARVRFGLKVISDDPLWYARSVARRGISTLRLERVPVIAAERDEREGVPPPAYQINVPLKFVQRVFITAVFLPLMLLGIVAAYRNNETRRYLVILAIVPLYYMTVQALIHTEYRYVLASSHIMLIFAAVGLSFLLGFVVRKKESDDPGLA